MAIESDFDKPAALTEGQRRGAFAFLSWLTGPLRFLSQHIFSSLTKRILILNLAALGVLVVGILYMNQFRDGLIDARVESLMTQGEIIAGAIASSATVETDSISIDPEKLLELQAGQSLAPGSEQLDSLDFPINPEQVAPLLRRLISPTRTRARIYDRDANLLLDSRHLYSRGQILRYDLPTMEESGFPDFAIEGWYGIFVPAKTPRPIVDKLSADINKALREPDSMERWKTLGFDPIGSTPEVFAERQKADLAYWKRMIDYTGIKVE